MRLPWLVCALMLAAAPGCDAVTCRDQTLYLTLEYAAASSASETLELDVSVGSQHQRYERVRTPGQARDTLEVVFQRYPAGETVSLVATAMHAGQTVGSGQRMATLAPRCSALSLTLAGAAGEEDADLADGTQPPADLSGPATPVLAFAGQHNTGQSPSSTMGALYEDRCPTGYALIGFNFSATNEIDNDKPVCARADLVASVGGGWTATWGPTTFLPYHGPNGDPGNQRLCPAGSFVRGFSGTSAVYLQSVLMLCSTIVVSQDKQVSSSANGYSMVFGPAAGHSFDAIICPTGEVATMRRERQDTNIPAYAFGLACSSIAAN
jgi:hypothetical protein